MTDSAAQTKEEALDVLLLAVRRFLYPRPTPDAAELQVSRSIDKLVKAFHAWEVAAPACQATDTALADLKTAYEVIVFARTEVDRMWCRALVEELGEHPDLINKIVTNYNSHLRASRMTRAEVAPSKGDDDGVR